MVNAENRVLTETYYKSYNNLYKCVDRKIILNWTLNSEFISKWIVSQGCSINQTICSDTGQCSSAYFTWIVLKVQITSPHIH